VVCGAAASGNYVWNDPTDVAKLLTCCMMSGPFLTGYTQTINDYYDREIDAINEPYRPIPSGGLCGDLRSATSVVQFVAWGKAE
jgi:chlorophyll synthase